MQTRSTAGAGGRGTLRIKVIRAYDLKDTELLGQMDPYVRIECNGVKADSVTDKSGGKDPTWNDVVSLPRTSGPTSLSDVSSADRDVIKITVVNSKTVLPDRVIGTARFPLSKLEEGRQGGAEKLMLMDKKGAAAGFLEVEFSPTGERAGVGGATDKTGYATQAAPAPAFAPGGPATFTTVEPHEMVKERVETVRETAPVEKEYVVETKPAGERRLEGEQEVIDVKERTVGGQRGATERQCY